MPVILSIVLHNSINNLIKLVEKIIKESNERDLEQERNSCNISKSKYTKVKHRFTRKGANTSTYISYLGKAIIAGGMISNEIQL